MWSRLILECRTTRKSVWLWCCKCSAHSSWKSHLSPHTLPPSSVEWLKPHTNQGHCGLRTAAPAAFVAWVSFWRCFLFGFYTAALTGTTNISGHAIEKHRLWSESILLWKQNKQKKKEVLYFLCGFISTCNKRMSRWVLTGYLKLTTCPADWPEPRMMHRCWNVHRTAQRIQT